MTAKTSSRDAFRTHFNYVECVEMLTRDLEIKFNPRSKAKLDAVAIHKFEELAKLTWRSIEGEIENCKNAMSFSFIIAPWIPVKCYYYLYYLESIFLYLVNLDQVGFNQGGHSGVRKALKDSITGACFTFAGPGAAELMKITDWITADKYITKGSTISLNYFKDPQCPHSLRGKLAEYMKIDWLSRQPFKEVRTNIAKEKQRNDLFPKGLNILDYFYLLRLKANYREIDFLDFEHDITELDTYSYVKKYVSATKQYGNALFNAIITLKIQRGIVVE